MANSVLISLAFIAVLILIIREKQRHSQEIEKDTPLQQVKIPNSIQFSTFIAVMMGVIQTIASWDAFLAQITKWLRGE